jgi:hypothetical protein
MADRMKDLGGTSDYALQIDNQHPTVLLSHSVPLPSRPMALRPHIPVQGCARPALAIW